MADPVIASFTGTRHGMSAAQFHTLADRIMAVRQGLIVGGHHGDCIGADEQFHYLMLARGLWTEAHPCDIEALRANVVGARVVHDIRPPLVRNRYVVDAGHILIATPHRAKPEPRSGTWATIRYARAEGKPVYVIWPNGEVARWDEEVPRV